jgi:hypothetical protein
VAREPDRIPRRPEVLIRLFAILVVGMATLVTTGVSRPARADPKDPPVVTGQVLSGAPS